MGLTKTTKQAYERYFICGDFSSVMEAEETIASAVISALNAEGEDATDTIIDDGSDYVEGLKQYVRIKDGSADESPYKITIRVETSKGNRWEVDGLVIIKET